MNAPTPAGVLPRASLASSFVKAQKGFAPALKSSTNPHFKSKYVDLAGCVDAVIDSLNANGIALIQQTHESDSGVIVETIFLHESGETLSCGKLHVPATKHDAQGYGSALTYARRYSLMAACGIAPEDDDGNAATKKHLPPVKAAMQSVEIDPASQTIMRELAAELVQIVEVENNPVLAYTRMEETGLNADEKLFLWDVLSPNSKTRSALKKEGQNRRLVEQA